MILDTNALSAAADSNPRVIALLADADEVAIPVIVLGEYRYGIAQSRNRASYANWLKGLLQDCLVLDIHEPTTQHYAEITLELKAKGQPDSHQRCLDRSPVPPARASITEPRSPLRSDSREQTDRLVVASFGAGMPERHSKSPSPSRQRHTLSGSKTGAAARPGLRFRFWPPGILQSTVCPRTRGTHRSCR